MGKYWWGLIAFSLLLAMLVTTPVTAITQCPEPVCIPDDYDAACATALVGGCTASSCPGQICTTYTCCATGGCSTTTRHTCTGTCTPTCTTGSVGNYQACGTFDDGCGGSCTKSCMAGSICSAGSCKPCNSVCNQVNTGCTTEGTDLCGNGCTYNPGGEPCVNFKGIDGVCSEITPGSGTYTCRTSCVPRSVAVACGSNNCGSADDGCGGTISCGTCAAPNTCSVNSGAGVCRCIPKTQAQACGSNNCGSADDGCGGTISCGTCTSPQVCSSGSGAGTCQTPACTTCTASNGACVANGAAAPAGTTQAGKTCCGSTFIDLNNAATCGTTCSNYKACNLPNCAKDPVCSSGTCTFTCWSTYLGEPKDAQTCYRPLNECQAPATLNTPGQLNCDAKPKIKIGKAMCNADPVAAPLYDTTKLSTTGLPYGKPAWGNTASQICGVDAQGMLACISGCAPNFNGPGCTRSCGANNQAPCNSASKYVNDTKPVADVPDAVCAPDNSRMGIGLSTTGNITYWRGVDPGGITRACNNTMADTGGDITTDTVTNLITLQETTGICCYNGAGSDPSNAWKARIKDITGNYVGDHFVCNNLVVECVPPQCTCTGAPAPSTVACGTLIKYKPGSPTYCTTMTCGKGTKDCPKPPSCGNSIIDGTDKCDKGAANGVECTPAYGSSCSYCAADCSSMITVQGGVCGDGNKDAPEACDAGADNGKVCVPAYGGSCSYCKADCSGTIVVDGQKCGDGTVNGPVGAEECDRGASNGACPAYCSATCTNNNCPEICANGIDDNLDGQADYYGPSSMTPKGDMMCLVNLVGITNTTAYARQQFVVSCATSMVGVTSAPPSDLVSLTGCDAVAFRDWTTNNISNFLCTVNAPGTKTLTCTVNTLTYSFSAVRQMSKTLAIPCPPGTAQSGSTCVEAACADGVDNDLSFSNAGDKDWDGVAAPIHGDLQCKVSVSDLRAPAGLVVSAGFPVTCNSSQKVRSVGVSIDGPGLPMADCPLFGSWSGSGPYTGTFNCPAAPVVGTYNISCFVDPSKSYQSGSNASRLVNSVCPSGWLQIGNACVNCDADGDGYYNKTYAACGKGPNDAGPGPSDCRDVGTFDGVPSSSIHPGAPRIHDNLIDEDCSGCISRTTVTWNGKLYDPSNIPVDGTVKTDDGKSMAVPASGVFSLSGVGVGSRKLTGSNPLYDADVRTVDIDFCSPTFTQDMHLQAAACQLDGTFSSVCRYDLCPSACNWAATGMTAAEQAAVKDKCNFQDKGTVVGINSTHSFVCCACKVVPTSTIKNPLTLQGCSDNLITLSRTVNYKGRILTLDIITYNKCE